MSATLVPEKPKTLNGVIKAEPVRYRRFVVGVDEKDMHVFILPEAVLKAGSANYRNIEEALGGDIGGLLDDLNTPSCSSSVVPAKRTREEMEDAPDTERDSKMVMSPSCSSSFSTEENIINALAALTILPEYPIHSTTSYGFMWLVNWCFYKLYIFFNNDAPSLPSFIEIYADTETNRKNNQVFPSHLLDRDYEFSTKDPRHPKMNLYEIMTACRDWGLDE